MPVQLPTPTQLNNNSQNEILEAIRGGIRQNERMARRVSPRSSMMNNESSNIIFGEGDPFDDSGTSPFTGTGIVYPALATSTGNWHIFGMNAGVLQFGLSATDGRIYFGGGAGVLDDAGIRLVPGVAETNGATYKFSDGTTNFGGISFTQDLINTLYIRTNSTAGSASSVSVYSSSPNGKESSINLRAEETSADAAQISIYTSGGLSTVTFLADELLWGTARMWKLVYKTADETIQSDATVNFDSLLQFSVVSGKEYHIRGRIFFDTTAAADFKYRFNAPTVTIFRAKIQHIIPGTTALVPSIETVIPTTTNSVVGAGTTGGYVEIDAVCVPSANGTFSFQWSQNTSTAANTTVLAGSYLEYTWS